MKTIEEDFFIVKDYSGESPNKIRKLQLGNQSVTVSEKTLVDNFFLYWLPEKNGKYCVNGVTFIKNEKYILVKYPDQYPPDAPMSSDDSIAYQMDFQKAYQFLQPIHVEGSEVDGESAKELQDLGKDIDSIKQELTP